MRCASYSQENPTCVYLSPSILQSYFAVKEASALTAVSHSMHEMLCSARTAGLTGRSAATQQPVEGPAMGREELELGNDFGAGKMIGSIASRVEIWLM